MLEGEKGLLIQKQMSNNSKVDLPLEPAHRDDALNENCMIAFLRRINV